MTFITPSDVMNASNPSAYIPPFRSTKSGYAFYDMYIRGRDSYKPRKYSKPQQDMNN